MQPALQQKCCMTENSNPDLNTLMVLPEFPQLIYQRVVFVQLKLLKLKYGMRTIQGQISICLHAGMNNGIVPSDSLLPTVLLLVQNMVLAMYR